MAKLLKLSAIFGLGLVAMSNAASAHTGVDGGAHHFINGFLHPLTGLDHILAMVAVGVFAAYLGGRSLWLVPSAFVATMVAGGALGYHGYPLPLVEQGIGASVVLLGLVVAAGLRVPAFAAMALVGLFALFHGHAHGAEGAESNDFLPYAAGFVVATGLLHFAGITLGLGLDRFFGERAMLARRILGIAGALGGIYILAA